MKTQGTPTPLVDSEERKVIVARRLALAVAGSGSSVAMMAAAIGVSRALLRQWMDADANKPLSVAHALGLPPVVRRAIVELLADSLGLELVETCDVDAQARVAALAVKSSEAVATLASASADGHISVIEGAELARVGRELSAQGQTLIRLGEQAVRERGVRVVS